MALHHAGGKLIASGVRRQAEKVVHVRKFRRADACNAVYRAECFARRVWSSRVVRLQKHLAPACKIGIVMGLAKWLFAALAAPLVPLAQERDETAAKLQAATDRVQAADAALAEADAIEKGVSTRRADHAARLMLAATSPKHKMSPQMR